VLFILEFGTLKVHLCRWILTMVCQKEWIYAVAKFDAFLTTGTTRYRTSLCEIVPSRFHIDWTSTDSGQSVVVTCTKSVGCLGRTIGTIRMQGYREFLSSL
jgi:hypothetical protein